MPESASSRPAGPSFAAQPAAFTMLVNLIFCFVIWLVFHVEWLFPKNWPAKG
jgi:hypothetical protein